MNVRQDGRIERPSGACSYEVIVDVERPDEVTGLDFQVFRKEVPLSRNAGLAEILTAKAAAWRGVAVDALTLREMGQ